MRRYSTREAAHELGLDFRTIQRYLAAGKIPAPPVERIGGGKYRAWTGTDIERVRKILPKIKNGRKTRYTKKQLAIGNQQLAKSKSKTKKSQKKK
ncbi:MAG TPA: MerR family transcriptional regulator [Candidatus Angelobacter sp.]